MITDLAASYIRSPDYQTALRPYPPATRPKKDEGGQGEKSQPPSVKLSIVKLRPLYLLPIFDVDRHGFLVILLRPETVHQQLAGVCCLKTTLFFSQ
jgi:hypothetical protein